MRFSVLVACICAGVVPPASAELNVFLDFNSNWPVQMDLALSLVSKPALTNSEREQIIERTVFNLEQIYSGYVVDFSLGDPGGERKHVDFGVAEPGIPGTGKYGSTPAVPNFGNYVVDQTISIFPSNFANLIQFDTNRSVLVDHFGRSLANVAAHEMGHSLGLSHWHAFGDAGITPANYANTGGLQKLHVMCDLDNGATAADQLLPHAFNRWERALLDITGGTAYGGASVVNHPITEVNEAADAGSTSATARMLSFKSGESSGMKLSLRRGHLDGSGADVDVYQFTTTSAGLFTAELFSGASIAYTLGKTFDGQLRLLDADGVSVLATNDGVRYTAFNEFNSGTLRASDPWLNNIPLPGAGTYFLEVSGLSNADSGDQYQLLAGFDGTIGSLLDGDADFDGRVDLTDLYALATHWQQPGEWAGGDFDGDGVVDAHDLGLLAGNWQAGVAGASLSVALTNLGLPMVAVPEPTSLLPLVLGGLLTRFRRRKLPRLSCTSM